MKNIYRLISAFTAITAVSLAICEPVIATSFYSITDLGTLGGNTSSATQINDVGQVIGISQNTKGESHYFLWNQNEGMQDLSNSIVGDLYSSIPMQDAFHKFAFYGTYPGGYSSPGFISMDLSWSPIYLNNSGQLLGSWNIHGGSLFREIGMFYRSQTGQVYNLGSFGGGFETFANRIGLQTPTLNTVPFSPVVCSNNPKITLPWGYMGTGGQYEFSQACVSITGKATVEFAGNLSDHDHYSGLHFTFHLNDTGQVFGYERTANKENMAFVWSEKDGKQNLGISGEWGSSINPNVLDNFDGNWHNSSYNSTNSNSVRVGSQYNLNFNPFAVIWENDEMSDLNTLIPDDSGWFLSSANSINKFGQIVGSGIINGQEHAFLLTPVSELPKKENSVPEPTSVITLLGFGLVSIGALIKRKHQYK